MIQKDFFKEKANHYEKDNHRVSNVQNIAHAIIDKVDFTSTMHIMDFGSGTGLLLEKIAPYVGKITAVDMSASMNKKLEEKRDLLECEFEILERDLSQTTISKKFDSIISSMTLHHVKDIKKLLLDFYTMLNDKGTIALADLDQEDGTFHTEDTGVHHHGFDREKIVHIAQSVGFKQVEISLVSIAKKPQGEYPIFLLTGRK